MEIVPVTDGRGLRQFIAFPYELYRDDPLWAPPLRRDVRTLLTPGRNPFFEHAEAQYFVAVAEPKGLPGGRGRMVGRIAAIKNDAHNKEHNDRVGFYGFFESVNDQGVATALFDAAARWLRDRGADTMRGPMNPSINDECGLLVHGFDHPPVILMTHNPRYYVDLHERYGFVKAKDLLGCWGGAATTPERLLRAARIVAQRMGVTLRPLNMKRFRDEVALVKDLYNRAWEKNWGFVPMTDAELDHLAKQLKPIIVPDLVGFAEAKGEVIGFVIAIPDLNVALRRNRSGRLFPAGLLRILWHARRIDRCRIPLVGTIPAYRGKGIDALLYHFIWTHCVARGMPQGEGGWILEDNAPMINGMTQLGFTPYKTYRILDKAL